MLKCEEIFKNINCFKTAVSFALAHRRIKFITLFKALFDGFLTKLIKFSKFYISFQLFLQFLFVLINFLKIFFSTYPWRQIYHAFDGFGL